MKRLIFTLIAFIGISSQVNAQWSWQSPLSSSLSYYSVQFLSPGKGYIIGDNGFMIRLQKSGINDMVIRTNSTATFAQFYPNSLCFLNNDTGYIYGGMLLPAPVIKTTDGGLNWFYCSLPGTLSSVTSLFFTNPDTGFASNGSTIFETTDGGTFWTLHTFGSYPVINSIVFTGTDTGYISGNNGFLQKTTDGGASWTVLSSGTTNNILSICFPAFNTGYAGCSGGVILKTTNGGNNWTNQSIGFNANITSLFFFSLDTGLAVCNNSLYYTSDGGISWDLMLSSNYQSINSVYFNSSTDGWAVGPYGILHTTDGGASWTELTSNRTFGYSSVCFSDVNTGFTFGGSYNSSSLIKTTDAGSQWVTTMPGTNNAISSACFTSHDTGYACGMNGTILKTINAGNSWSSLSSGNSNDLSSVFFTGSSVGYVTGLNGTLLKTTNSGANWTSLNSGTSVNLFSLYFPSLTTGYAVGEAGTILVTVNSGTNWTTVTSGTTDDLFSIFFSNSSTGYITGDNGKILKTTNGGASWLSQASGVNVLLKSVFFTGNNTGFAVGDNGNIIKTTNGGASWMPQSSGTSSCLNSVYFTSPGTGYAVGDSCIVIQTINGGLTWFRTQGILCGTYSYHNYSYNPPLPMDSTRIHLINNGNIVDSTETDVNGFYYFLNVRNGNYYIDAITLKPLGGVNSTDAVKVKRHFAGSELFTSSIQLHAADVNLSYGINTTDAVNITRRFVGFSSSFTRGDWVFEKPTGGDTIDVSHYLNDSVIVNSINVNQNFSALCVGDVNESYFPPFKSFAKVQLTNTGVIKSGPDEDINLAIFAGGTYSIGSISLIMDFPSDLVSINDISLIDNGIERDLYYNIINNELRIGWFETAGAVNVDKDNAVLVFKIKTKNSFTYGKEILFTVKNNPLCEFSDENGEPFTALLNTYQVKNINSQSVDNIQNNEFNEFNIYPNPLNEDLKINYSIANSGFLKISIFNILGEKAIDLVNSFQIKGTYNQDFNLSSLSSGVYSCIIILDNRCITVKKIVINR